MDKMDDRVCTMSNMICEIIECVVCIVVLGSLQFFLFILKNIIYLWHETHWDKEYLNIPRVIIYNREYYKVNKNARAAKESLQNIQENY